MVGPKHSHTIERTSHEASSGDFGEGTTGTDAFINPLGQSPGPTPPFSPSTKARIFPDASHRSCARHSRGVEPSVAAASVALARRGSGVISSFLGPPSIGQMLGRLAQRRGHI